MSFRIFYCLLILAVSVPFAPAQQNSAYSAKLLQLESIANDLVARGKFDRAEGVYREMSAIWDEANLPLDDNYFAIQFRIGSCSLAGGRSASALPVLIHTINEWREHGRSSTNLNYLSALSNLGTICSEVGQDSEADTLFDLAIAECRAIGVEGSGIASKTLRNRSIHKLLLGNTAAARSYWLICSQHFADMSKPLEQAQMALISARIHLADSQWRDSENDSRRAIKILGDIVPSTDSTLMSAQLTLLEAAFAEAPGRADHFDTCNRLTLAFNMSRRSHCRDSLTLLLLRAKLEAARGKTKNAFAYCQEALSLHERLSLPGDRLHAQTAKFASTLTLGLDTNVDKLYRAKLDVVLLSRPNTIVIEGVIPADK